MAAKLSAGLLPYRWRGEWLEVFLVHPGGPFWASKDSGAWSIAKGEYQRGDDPWRTALREWEEEIGHPAPVGDATLPPAWSGTDGYALLVRGVGIPQALLLGAALVLRGTGTPATPLAMAADLPLFWWVARYLRATGSGWRETFGVPARPGSGPRLAAVAAMLIGVALVGDSAIDTLTTWVGLPSHWADGFAEDLLWNSRGQFVVDAFNLTVWAPMVEELTFRGLLYGTLRTRLAVGPAAAISAVLFAVPHGYAAAGTLSVLMSGVLWALAYERTRSLLPGLIAHAVNNLMSTLWVVIKLVMKTRSAWKTSSSLM